MDAAFLCTRIPPTHAYKPLFSLVSSLHQQPLFTFSLDNHYYRFPKLSLISNHNSESSAFVLRPRLTSNSFTMKVSALFLVLAAVATAAPAVQPETAPRGLLDPVTGAAGSLTGGLGNLGGLLDPVTGALAGITKPITDLVHNLLVGVDQKVLPILAGQPDSVVHLAIETINRVIASLPVDGAGLPDTSGLTASLEQALNDVLAQQGVVSQVVQAVDAAVAGAHLPVKRALPVPIDLASLNLPGLGGLSGLVGEVVELVNQLLASLTGGGVLSAADLEGVSSQLNAVSEAVAQGKAAGIDTSALSGVLGPLLSTLDGLLSVATDGDKALDVQNAAQGIVGAVGALLTSLGAVKGLNKAVTDTLNGLSLTGPLAGVVSTVLALLQNLLGGLGLGGLVGL